MVPSPALLFQLSQDGVDRAQAFGREEAVEPGDDLLNDAVRTAGPAGDEHAHRSAFRPGVGAVFLLAGQWIAGRAGEMVMLNAAGRG